MLSEMCAAGSSRKTAAMFFAFLNSRVSPTLRRWVLGQEALSSCTSRASLSKNYGGFSCLAHARWMPLVINAALQRRKVTEVIQDVDFYALKAKNGVPLHLYTVAYQLRAPEIDTVLRVLDSKGKVLAESDDLTAGRGFLMGSADSSLFYVPEQDEEIFVTVLDRVGRGGPSYQYRLHIKVEEPGFHLIVAPQSGLRSVP